jgi:oligopeptidase A
MTNATFSPSTLPNFKSIDPAQIETTICGILDNNRKKIAALLTQPGPLTWENLMQPLEDMADTLGNTWSPISHMHAVMETEPLREAYNHTLPALTEYHTEISQNKALYETILFFANSPAFAELNAAQRKIIENDIRDFKLSGVNLPEDKKDRMAELEQQLSKLTTKFSENLLDATHAWTMHFTDKQALAGLPPQALQLAADNAKLRKLDGYVLTLDYPSYSTAIQFLNDRQLRHTIYEAYVTRASDAGPYAKKWDNTHIMEDILRVRHEIAALVGYKNYADYSLATKMAKSPDDVLRFLRDLLSRSKPMAVAEIKELAALAKQLDNIDKLEPWDVPYYSEKLQASKFQFTQEELRPYFPIDRVLQGLFHLVQTLYGISIREEKNIPVWHPDVRFFSIYDANNHLRSGFYIDLYARQHKNGGAWMDDCRSRRRLNNHDIQLPVAYLTCNFMPPVGDQPALLTHDDVITLFHEFGHCLHHMLTQVDYMSVSGVNGVPWDAIEFPSQFMENFCWEKEILAMIAAHYKTGEPIPDELYQKMLNAKHFQTGMQMVRQLEFALFDFRLHHECDPNKPAQVQHMLDDVRKHTALLNVPTFNRFQHSFSHIFAGGYAAGYYSYKWAEVLSADAYAQFEENGILDQATGQSFLHNILEVGGVRDPMASFTAFRGRAPSIDALLRHSGIA